MPDVAPKSSTKPSSVSTHSHPAARKPETVRAPIVASRKQKLINSLKTFAWVAPLTILIWTYAEREQVVSQSVNVPIEIKTDATDRVVTINPVNRSIVVDVSGPKVGVASIEEFSTSNDAHRKPLEIFISRDELPTAPSDMPGDHADLASDRTAANPDGSVTGKVSIIDRLSQNDIFRQNAVKVLKCNPSLITVTVDRLERRRLPVEIAPREQTLGFKLANEQGGALEVVATGPSATLNAIAKGKAAIYAELDLIKDRKGRFDTDLHLYLSTSAEHVKLPNTVHAVVTATEAETLKIPSLPIFILAPRDLLDKFKVELIPADARVYDISVAGPPDEIKRLTSAEPFYATLRVSPADLPSGEERHHPLTAEDFNLPKDVVITSELKDIAFKLTPRPRDGEGP